MLAQDCDQQDYTKLIQALCTEANVNLITVPENKQLGEWVGLCKLDTEGKARKVVGCSCVVIKVCTRVAPIWRNSLSHVCRKLTRLVVACRITARRARPSTFSRTTSRTALRVFPRLAVGAVTMSMSSLNSSRRRVVYTPILSSMHGSHICFLGVVPPTARARGGPAAARRPSAAAGLQGLEHLLFLPCDSSQNYIRQSSRR